MGKSKSEGMGIEATETKEQSLLAAKESPTERKKYPRRDGKGFVEELDLDSRPRQGTTLIVCPAHACKCEATNSDPLGAFTRYQCPVEDCPFSLKVAKPTIQQLINRQRDEEDFSAR